MRRLALLGVASLALLAGWSQPAAATPRQPLLGNLLAEKDVAAAEGVQFREHLTDGFAEAEGGPWLTTVNARLRSESSYAAWDLGPGTPIRCLLLQGDGNDSYRLDASDDGEQWTTVWTAAPVRAAGMRTRQTMLDVRTRYLRVSAWGGDGLFSVGELAAWTTCPEGWPEVGLQRASGVNIPAAERTRIQVFALAGLVFILFHRPDRRAWMWGLAAAAVVAGLHAARGLIALRPYANTDEESLVRAVVALLAGALVVRETFMRPQRAPDRRAARVTLVVLAALAIGCYTHFGMLQFHDPSSGRRTFVHSHDMRHYFPAAKYFHELRYDGLYLASLAAYLEVEGQAGEAATRGVRMRDLTTYGMITADAARARLPEIRARFTPERWEEFRRDMTYFIRSMGREGYLSSMRDHGSNATPAWLLPAWLIFRGLPANEWTLTLAGLIDPLLLALLFVALWRTFGERVALYTIVLFGATDFYQLGSNWFGSTLRQDWLVALGLGVCALAAGRSFLGGTLLGWAGAVRAFPGLAALFQVVPALWQKRVQRQALLGAAGAVAVVLLLVAASGAVFGWTAGWGAWWSKVGLHSVNPAVNNVGLRNVLSWRPAQAIGDLGTPAADWERLQRESFASLRPVFWLVNALAAAAVLLACRGRSAHQAALLGLLLIPFLFYPSNYYCHFICLLPLAVAPPERGDVRDRTYGWVVVVLLALCLGQYATLAERGLALRFTWQSLLLLAACAAIIAPLAWRGRKGDVYEKGVSGTG